MTDQKIAFGFDGGAIGGAIPDVVQPPGFALVANVRHTLERGAPKKAARLNQDAYTATSPTGLCTGVVPHPRSDSCLFGFDAPIRVTDAGAAPLTRHDGADGSVTCVRTLEVIDAGVTMPGRSACVPSVAVASDGSVWTAQVQQTRLEPGSPLVSGDLGAYVSFRGADGLRVFERSLACIVETGSTAILNAGAWCAITAHDGNTAVLWYRAAVLFGADQPIKARRLSVGLAGELVVGPEATILAPAMTGLDKCLTPAVVATDAFAWAACPTANGNLRVVAVDVATLAVLATSDIAVSGGTLIKGACSLALAGASNGVVVAFCGPSVTGWWLLDNTLGVFASSVNVAGLAVGSCCALYYESGGASYVGAAFSAGDAAMPLNASAPTPVRPAVYLSLRRIGGAGEEYAGEIPHARLAAGYSANAGANAAPIIAVSPWYGPFTDTDDPAYVIDPSITLVAIKPIAGGDLEVGPCGRFGVDRMTPEMWSRAQGTVGTGTAIWGASMQARGGRFALAYLEASETDGFATDAGLVGRYAILRLGSHQPPVTQVGGALAIAGGSMPLYWDGTELAELCPMQAPTVWLESGTDSGTITVDGEFVAVVSWRDASGQEHRSTPSRPLRVQVPGSTTRKIMVAKSLSTHNARTYGPAVCRLYYASATGSGVHKLVATAEPDLAEINGCWAFGVRDTVTDDAPILYTEGGELPPEHPPAVQDALVALDRVWLIDAESRSDVWYSKPAAPGLAPEFNGALRVTFPAAAGPLVALAEIGGQLIALGERGAAALYGDGPDALGNGGFGAPRLVAKIGCTSRRSVARYQGGVIYESHGRFVRLSAEGAQVLPGSPVVAASTLLGVSVLENGSEILWWGSTGAIVYNYETGAWNQWSHPAPTGGASAATIAAENSDGTRAWVARLVDGVGRVARLDGREASETEQAYWRTGWLIPPGDQQQDVTWSQVVIHALSESAHGLIVTIETDYGRTSAQQLAVWTAAEIAAVRERGRLTLSVDVKERAARSLRVTIQETGASGHAFRPVSCTIYYTPNDKNQNRRVLRPGARR